MIFIGTIGIVLLLIGIVLKIEQSQLEDNSVIPLVPGSWWMLPRVDGPVQITAIDKHRVIYKNLDGQVFSMYRQDFGRHSRVPKSHERLPRF